MTRNKHNVWISPRGNQWAVKREGSERASLLTDTKKEAEEFGREIAQREHGELISQKRDGTIGSKDSFGKDPCPPKDKEH